MNAVFRTAGAALGVAALLAAPGSVAQERTAVAATGEAGNVPEVVVRAQKLQPELVDLYAASDVGAVSVEGVLGDLSSRLTAPELPQPMPQPVLDDL